ncbi:T9SS type B sorting domain-containing protein [Winogradskyella ursingii]|uniref:T9SS type B sorting domain-containing protein n=1 Tax=Winogradskyella ursingii TaxID=2686079 RepID=UPI001FEC4214|nr:T9SS type B sorting domain-containing protein [Winogradskyella ursingii]
MKLDFYKKIRCIAFVALFSFFANAQEPNDCQFAVTVCGNSNLNIDANGIGTQELSGSNTCSSQENNSIWLLINIATSGTLGFTLTPESSDIGIDYDFFIYGPDVVCGNIGQAIRCSTTNPVAANQGNNLTGMNSTETDTSEGPGPDGNSFVRELNVLAGESYFFVIDRPIGTSPFSLEWTGTATFPDNPSNPLTTNASSSSLEDFAICDSQAPFDDNITAIDLTQLSQAIINGESDVVVSYHNTESDANLNINSLGENFNNSASPQNVYIRVENTTTGCFILNDFNIIVTALTNFNTPTDYPICDNDDDGDNQNGQVTFDFNTKTQEITENVPGANYNISYHLSESDAEANASPLPLIYTNNTPTPTEIFVRIFDNDSGCFGFTSFMIEVSEIPEANNSSILQCDEDGIQDGKTIFNINQIVDDITGGATGRWVEYYRSLNDAQDQMDAIDGDNFENITNPETVYARVTDTGTGCVNFCEVSLEVSTTTSNDTSLSECDDDGIEDGLTEFDLSMANSIVLAGSPAGLDIEYFETYEDALLETDPIGTTFTNTVAYNQTVYARVENGNACYGISEIELTVLRLPNIETELETFYCLNFFPETIRLDGGLIDDLPNNYFYEWSTGENTLAIEVNEPGTYTVRVTGVNGCFKDRTITVLPSNIATVTDIEVVDASQNNSVTVMVSGQGDYEYALDSIDGPYQDSNTFDNVQPGLYTVYVRDRNDCGITEQLVSVVGFPKFFTPNGDGQNDIWRVRGISSRFQANTKILIFDRYGKLLRELDPLGPGWDGTHNGQRMPTSDYWFKVKLEDGRTFTSHFTLKQ